MKKKRLTIILWEGSYFEMKNCQNTWSRRTTEHTSFCIPRKVTRKCCAWLPWWRWIYAKRLHTLLIQSSLWRHSFSGGLGLLFWTSSDFSWLFKLNQTGKHISVHSSLGPPWGHGSSWGWIPTPSLAIGSLVIFLSCAPLGHQRKSTHCLSHQQLVTLRDQAGYTISSCDCVAEEKFTHCVVNLLPAWVIASPGRWALQPWTYETVNRMNNGPALPFPA